MNKLISYNYQKLMIKYNRNLSKKSLIFLKVLMNNFKPHLYKKEKIKAKYKVNLIKKLKIFLNLYV